METLLETKKCYIAGKMTGLPLYGFPAFEEAEKILRGLGYEPISPAQMDIDRGSMTVERWKNGKIKSVVPTPTFSYSDALREDFKAIRQCQAIYLLPNWPDSPGARQELSLALELNLEIIIGK